KKKKSLASAASRAGTSPSTARRLDRDQHDRGATGSPSGRSSPEHAPATPRPWGAPALPPPLAAAFVLSGAAALIDELAWFRLLGHVFGSTATATVTLLAAYLFGLGLGALLIGRLAENARSLPLLYAAMEA